MRRPAPRLFARAPRLPLHIAAWTFLIAPYCALLHLIAPQNLCGGRAAQVSDDDAGGGGGDVHVEVLAVTPGGTAAESGLLRPGDRLVAAQARNPPFAADK